MRRPKALFVALVLAFPFIASAIDIATLKPRGYVNDFASVIDPVSKGELETYLGQVEKATGAQFAFVTLDTLGGEAVEDFTNDLYRSWGVGQKGKDEGLLLLLVVRDKRSRLEVGRGLEEFIPDGVAGLLLRDMAPMLRESKYGDAFLLAGRKLAERVAKAKNVQIPTEVPVRSRPAPPVQDQIPWTLIVGAVLFLFLMSAGGRRRGGGMGGMGGMLPGLILGNMLGRSSYGGGYSGGGFGGSDSGDSFGGFGGGDSGGGGASGSW